MSSSEGRRAKGAAQSATVGAYTAVVDNGVPQTSKRAGWRGTGGGGAKSGSPKTPPKSNGAASSRPGPIDPRTEDASAPNGLARAGKTIWRRPGALTPRTAKHREVGTPESPINFTAELPLASPPIDDDAKPITVARTIEVPPAKLPDAEPMPAFLPTVVFPAPSPVLYDDAATVDDVTKIGPLLDPRPLHRPVHFRRRPKPRVRRVTRVVRHVDTWSVFKVALVFSVFFYAVAMVAGVLLWQVAYATGTIDNVEKFFEGFGWETFKFNGGQIFHNAWIAGLFVAVGLTGLAVLIATLFNLITDLVGGIRLSVLEEEVRTRAERGTEHVHNVTAQPHEHASEPFDERVPAADDDVVDPTMAMPDDDTRQAVVG